MAAAAAGGKGSTTRSHTGLLPANSVRVLQIGEVKQAYGCTLINILLYTLWTR
jgi:hypothetical protein